MERKDELEARVREAPLSERLDECRKRIGKMCSEGRPPRMCIPVQWDDDDFYISTTLADAQRALDVEREKVRELEQEGLQLFEWRLALHSLTPGGSEFCTPDACEQWVRKIRTSQHEYIIEQIKQRKVLQSQLSQLQALVRALPVVRIDLNGAYHDTLLAQPEDEAVKELLRYRASLDATTPDSNQLGAINDMVSKGGDGE